MDGAISIAEARERNGLRLILLRGVPSPWSQAAKGIVEYKGIEYTRVHAGKEDSPTALVDWTSQTSFPAAMYEEEPARTGWAEILLLAERLAPDPALIPKDAAQRALLFGYAHEICGEMGLGWARRLTTIARGLDANPEDGVSKFLGTKYGLRDDASAAAIGRTVAILGSLDALLQNNGGRYLLGEFSALDIYWATFSNLIAPLPADKLPMHEAMRPMFTAFDEPTLAALTPELLALRDRLFDEHLTLPVEL